MPRRKRKRGRSRVVAPSSTKKSGVRGPKRLFTAQETREQFLHVEELLTFAYTVQKIRALCVEHFGYPLTTSRVERLVERVREQWRREDHDLTKDRRVQQIKTLEAIARAALGKGQLHNALRAQELLSDILGTKEPIKVSIDTTIKHSVMAVMGTLAPEEFDRLLQEGEKKDRAYQALVAEGVEVEDSTATLGSGEPAPARH